jgi:hypothetical protein
MAAKKSIPKSGSVKLDEGQIAYLEGQMARLAERNPSWKIQTSDHKTLFPYLVAQKLTYLYDDEVFELLTPVDTHLTGKEEELLDHYLILDTGEEVQLKLFQFKFREKYDGGVSTKELYAFVERMNKVFLHGDLQDDKTLEAFKEVRDAFERALKANPKARARVHCFYIVNGQNVSPSDSAKLEQIRTAFQGDRQTYGFTFEAYGGLDIFNLCVHGRVPIQREVLELECPAEKAVLHLNIGSNPNGMPIQVVQGFVNVNQLVRLVDRYSNNELFERNVRLFLGVKKEVNKRIIETITSNHSSWFGFMNNGVSITADDVVVNPPPSGKKLRVMVDNMQIINGCQTVNALYHAKYDPALKDKFQGNSNVLLRIYHIDPANQPFMEALIIATNSQNAIRAEDLVANDPPQKELEAEFRRAAVVYERKEGSHNGGRFWFVTTKESAAMAFIAVFWEAFASKLRNSASRREIFRKGDEYLEIFSWGDDQPEATRYPAETIKHRAVQMLAAAQIEGALREMIAESEGDRKRRGALRKAAYFLARAVYLQNRAEIEAEIKNLNGVTFNQPSAQEFSQKIKKLVGQSYTGVVKIFDQAMKAYVDSEGGDEDAALKNTKFAKALEKAVKGKKRKAGSSP